MTVLERVKECVNHNGNVDYDVDSIEKVIALAYFIGREEATKEVSDKYTALLAEQRERANNCRYKHLAHSVIGDTDYIYSPDYAQDMTATFGSDETNV